MNLKNYINLKEDNFLKIKVIPNQPKTEFFSVMDDGVLKIRLRAIPEKWKANKELIKFLSKELNIPKEKISISSWSTGKSKRIKISK